MDGLQMQWKTELQRFESSLQHASELAYPLGFQLNNDEGMLKFALHLNNVMCM